MYPLLQHWKVLYSHVLSRRFGVSSVLNSKNHYDALGITPKATQADVKAAYYKLSMLYHPDTSRNKSVGDGEKFRDITEAYEVLGNVRLRRMYDRGIHHPASSSYTQEDVDNSRSRFRPREKYTRPPSSGRAPIYDFDEWARNHYGETFMRDQELKKRTEYLRKRAEMEKNEMKVEKVLIVMAALFFMILYVSGEGKNHDVVVYQKKAKTED